MCLRSITTCSPQRAEPSTRGRTAAQDRLERSEGDREHLLKHRHTRPRSQVFHENEPLTPRGVALANEIIPGSKGRHTQGGPEAKQGSFQEQLRDTAWLETPLVTKSSEAQMWLSGDLG